ncbi:MAG: redoxin domain-containing protein [Acidimicrobiia bacterium]|nr:redoxin domain-containing protein [Acidimicrobiia bacterium]
MHVGDRVKDFTAVDQNGNATSLYDLLAEGPVVVFFYPKAMTGGCTTESCHFRNLKSEFDEFGARAVGISTDTVETQAEFDRVNGLRMPLLSDPDRSIAHQFGVKRPGPLPNKRSTFVIDQDGTLLSETNSETNMELHADEALEVLRAHAGVPNG